MSIGNWRCPASSRRSVRYMKRASERVNLGSGPEAGQIKVTVTRTGLTGRAEHRFRQVNPSRAVLRRWLLRGKWSGLFAHIERPETRRGFD